MVMRLWRFSWKASRVISTIALIILTIPGFFLGLTIGRTIGTTQVNITNTIPADLRPTNSSGNIIENLPNNKLLSYTKQFAAKMRNFEKNLKDDRDRLLQSQHVALLNSQNFTSEQKQENWSRYTQQLIKQSNEQQAMFRNNYLPEAVILRSELEKRLKQNGVIPEQDVSEHFMPLVAFSGLLAGVSPISDAADYLENLARRLPD